MKLHKYVLLTCAIVCTIHAPSKESTPIKRESAHSLTLFMAPYEMLLAEKPFSEEIKAELFQDPFYLSKKIINEDFAYNSDPRGVYVLYAGYVDLIDFNRQVRFPLIGTGTASPDEFTLIVTRKLKPYLANEDGTTVKFFTRDPKYAIAYYAIKRNFDKKNNIHTWNITKIETPKDKQIPVGAIIIFAEPSHIIVPTEPVVAVAGPNVVLPTVYATKDLTKDYNAITFLKISKYFDPIHEITKIAPPKRYGQKIGNIGTA